MPTITSGLSPSPTGISLSANGGGGGIISSTGAAPTGTFSAYVAPAPTSTSYGSGSASSIAASVGQSGIGGSGSIESAFYDQRLAEIYYLGDKPWYDETRYDEFGFTAKQSNSNLKTALILAAVLLLAKQL